MSSILTNQGAMVALQTMKSINKNMGTVQNQISTGLKVGTAKDNSSSWAIATSMRSDVAAYSKLSDSLTSADAMVGVARTAAEQIVETLQLIREKVVQAKEPGADGTKIQADIDAMTDTINSIAARAQYNGINLVNNTETQDVVVSIGPGDSEADPAVTKLEQLAVTGVNLTVPENAFNLTANAETDLDAVDDALTAAIGAAAAFGSAQIRIEGQNNFLTKQMDAIKTGIGAIVDADMEEASARLQALQVQQQLGIQALSIANQQPQNILSLFR